MAIEILVPRLGWTMEEGALVRWLKNDGDPVAQGDLIFELEGDKALTEVESMDAGILRIPPDSPLPGTTVLVGARLAYIVETGEAAPFEKSGAEEKSRRRDPKQAQTSSVEESGGRGFSRVSVAGIESTTAAPTTSTPSISPRAMRVANELGVDWKQIKGSGRTGRIVEADVRAAAEPVEVQPAIAPVAATSGSATRTPLSATRRVIAERMSAGVHVAAPVTLTSEVDATELVRLREQLKNDQKATTIPSYTDLLAKIVAHALQEHPALNARMEGNEIVTEHAVHVGIAVDTDRGLLVPVVRDAQAKTLLQISAESAGLIARVREGKALADELRGSTFTISNLGMYDIDAFSPIINLPECAMLGMGRITAKQIVTLRPGTIDEIDRIAVRRMMTLSLTFDHRVVDGAPAARFLQRVKQLVEQPYLWLVS